jgi:hypothetical protein
MFSIKGIGRFACVNGGIVKVGRIIKAVVWIVAPSRYTVIY